MSPTYTMSAHLCKQIYASWRQTHDTTSPSTIVSYDGQTQTGVPKEDKHFYHINTTALSSYKPYQRSFSPPAPKRSMDSDRSSSSDSHDER